MATLLEQCVMKKTIRISFDLGIRGDYEGMYQFLDAHEAKECGDSLAVFQFDMKSDLIAELNKAIRKEVEVTRKSRIYIIFMDKGKPKGRFIAGARKSAPWTGYAKAQSDEEDLGD